MPVTTTHHASAVNRSLHAEPASSVLSGGVGGWPFSCLRGSERSGSRLQACAPPPIRVGGSFKGEIHPTFMMLVRVQVLSL
jgi:hypothetical protein